MANGPTKPDYATTTHGTVAAYGITPSDTVDIPTGVTRAIFVGTGGDLKVDLVAGGTEVYKNIGDGMRWVGHASRVYATGTTALNLIAEY